MSGSRAHGTDRRPRLRPQRGEPRRRPFRTESDRGCGGSGHPRLSAL